MQLNTGEDQKQKFSLREFHRNSTKYFMLTEVSNHLVPEEKARVV